MKVISHSAHILLIAPGQKMERRVRTSLRSSIANAFELESVADLSSGLARLHTHLSAVLLNLPLPDSEGIETFEKLYRAFPQTPILIVGEVADEALAMEAVQHGAQDYLLGRHINEYTLPRALSKAIERSKADDVIYAERELAFFTLNSIGDAVLSTDHSGNITFLNPVAEVMTGWSNEEASGKPLTEVFRIVDGFTRKVAPNPLTKAMKQDRAVGLTLNCLLVRRDGVEFAIEDSAAPIHNKAGNIIGGVIVFHDVSGARALSIQMTHSAHHDSVTGLPNRVLLRDRISQSIALASRHNRQIAVLFLDLDHFKNVNDSLGHAVGDGLLRSVSERLVGSLRDADTVSRQGGDEFVILLSDIADREDAAKSARRLLLALSAPHKIQNVTLHINGSLGISMFPEHGEDAESLIRNADVAMYQAKEGGRNDFLFFSDAMNSGAVKRQSIEAGLHVAIEKGQFVLHYQPRVYLDTGRISGFEAMIRWRHPSLGLLAPESFMSVAEDCGVIVEIGQWTLREACRQAFAWQQAGWLRVPLAVNLSAAEFNHPNFIEGLRSILAETGLEGHYLELGLTDGVLMKHMGSTASALVELKRMGVRLASGASGVGNSSLSYLRKLSIDVLKVDHSLISQVAKQDYDAVLASAIISIGRSLKCTVVADGIESLEQRRFLEMHHCHEGQGNLISKPLPAKLFARLLRSGIPVEVDTPATA